MSLRRTYCLVPPAWNAQQIAARRCDDRSHVHLSRSQVHEFESDGLLEWVHQSMSRHDKGIVRLRRVFAVRGLSCRVGEALAVAVRQGVAWALVMAADIGLEPATRMRL